MMAWFIVSFLVGALLGGAAVVLAMRRNKMLK